MGLSAIFFSIFAFAFSLLAAAEHFPHVDLVLVAQGLFRFNKLLRFLLKYVIQILFLEPSEMAQPAWRGDVARSCIRHQLV